MRNNKNNSGGFTDILIGLASTSLGIYLLYIFCRYLFSSTNKSIQDNSNNSQTTLGLSTNQTEEKNYDEEYKNLLLLKEFERVQNIFDGIASKKIASIRALIPKNSKCKLLNELYSEYAKYQKPKAALEKENQDKWNLHFSNEMHALAKWSSRVGYDLLQDWLVKNKNEEGFISALLNKSDFL